MSGWGENQILDWVIKDPLKKERRACADEWRFFLLLRVLFFFGEAPEFLDFASELI